MIRLQTLLRTTPAGGFAAVLSAVLVLTSCGRSRDVATADLPASQSPTPLILVRLASDGGAARAYRLPSLAEAEWKSQDKLPALDRLIGGDIEQRIVYVLDKKRNVVSVDLDTRRTRTLLSNARHAALGPDGTLYVIDSAGAVTRMLRRNPTRFRAKLEGTPRELFGTIDGALLAFLAGKSGGLAILSSDQPAAKVPMPAGDAAATLWGDLVAVASDSGVIIYDPADKAPPEPLNLGGRATSQAVLFSPSAHRLYVANDDGSVRVIDRFGHDVLATIELPGAARALRGDLYGEWLLAEPVDADSVWVVDVAAGRMAGQTAGRWAADLPAMAAPGTLLVRRGKDVIALQPVANGMRETGRVPGGAGDLWIAIPWAPEGEGDAPSTESDTTVIATTDSGGPAAPGIYLQVSSSQNGTWAANLADQLKGAGLPAAVLDPKSGEDAYRVVLGPYAGREEADEAGRKLGRPSFIITAQGDPGR